MRYFIEAEVIGTSVQDELDRKTGKKKPVRRAYLRIENVKEVAGIEITEVETRSAKTELDLDPGLQVLEIHPIPIVGPDGRAKLYFKIIGVWGD
jgi:hypothetical protein